MVMICDQQSSWLKVILEQNIWAELQGWLPGRGVDADSRGYVPAVGGQTSEP